jgi:hypothetical protein
MSTGSVCDNQADFNVAFRKALEANAKHQVKKLGNWIYLYVAIWAIFFVWAIILAMKMGQGPMRVLHLVLAILFSPVYVVSYYLCMLGGGKGARMGMCGGNMNYE